jgi:hypothetical protein
MKVRLDFVTNSSSSSYLIAFKDSNIFDEETLNKYPFLKLFPNIIETIMDMESGYDTTAAYVYETKEDYEQYLLDNYSYTKTRTIKDLIEGDSYVRNRYEKAVEYLSKGYKIAEKDIDYNDESLIQIIKALANDNDEFVLLEEDD